MRLTLAVLLMTVAGLALLLAMWFAVRRPPKTPTSTRRSSWHVLQAALSAISATTAALCVLLAVGAM